MFAKSSVYISNNQNKSNVILQKDFETIKILSLNTKLSIQELSKITKSDYFMDAQEAKAKGFVDTIITNN